MASNMEKAAIEKLKTENRFRYERKFILTADHRQQALFYIKTHPAFFREIFHCRQVNNIYLDTAKLNFYFANKAGVSERKKVRIRWYGNTFGAIHKPTLEYKIKLGLLGDKWLFALKNFHLNQGFEVHNLKKILRDSQLPSPLIEDLHNLTPTLLNSYKRTYFLSADKNFRLTLDEQLVYYQMDTFQNEFIVKYVELSKWIVEIKYEEMNDSRVADISKVFPCRMDKSSKYVNGIDFFKGRKPL